MDDSNETTISVYHTKQAGCIEGYEIPANSAGGTFGVFLTDPSAPWCNCPNGPQCVTVAAASSTVASGCPTCGRPW